MLLCGLMLFFCVTAISAELVGKTIVFLSMFELSCSTLLANCNGSCKLQREDIKQSYSEELVLLHFVIMTHLRKEIKKGYV